MISALTVFVLPFHACMSTPLHRSALCGLVKSGIVLTVEGPIGFSHSDMMLLREKVQIRSYVFNSPGFS